MPALRRVLLMVETASVLEGVGRYAAAHGRWSLCVNHRGIVVDNSLRILRSWDGDGIIFHSSCPSRVEAIRRKSLPAVDTNCGVIGHGFPLSYADDVGIVRLAIDHFVERQFRNFAFCAVEDPNWVQWRRRAYLCELKKRGFDAHVCALRQSTGETWWRQQQKLAEWAIALPKPVAILAANDVCATRLIAVCHAAGIRVPEEAAVLGVDNDEVLCNLSTPTLSSVQKDMVSTGYHAAALLDRLMEGEPAPPEPVWIPPLGVIARQSTDVMAVEDPEVVRAIQFIREHACNGIAVADVSRGLCVSRATLERKFASFLRITPAQAIAQLRAQRAKSLLAETEHSIKRIAQLAGYSTQAHLTVAFKRETGLTPGEFRRQHRGGQGACSAMG